MAFGDGKAAQRAEQAIAWQLGLDAAPPAPFEPVTTDHIEAAAS